jgi:broad specificity phosphatase PhoE
MTPSSSAADMGTDSGAGVADASFFAAIEEETHFYLLRHGQSEGNAKRMFQGRLDLPLAERGRAQARAAGAWLADKRIAAIYTSPLVRAAETARIVAQACGTGTEPHLDETFVEIDTGIFSGLGYDEARQQHPGIFAAFQGRSWEVVPGAEKTAVLYARAMRAWRLLREQALSGKKALACVSHGGFIQWLVRATFGCREWMPLFSTANCGVFELVVVPTRSGVAYLKWQNINFRPRPDTAPAMTESPQPHHSGPSDDPL